MKENDFYEEPQPYVDRADENGILLQFRAMGRGVSDYLLDPDDVVELYHEFEKWVLHYAPEKL